MQHALPMPPQREGGVGTMAGYAEEPALAAEGE
jgi:hypothetical protein